MRLNKDKIQIINGYKTSSKRGIESRTAHIKIHFKEDADGLVEMVNDLERVFSKYPGAVVVQLVGNKFFTSRQLVCLVDTVRTLCEQLNIPLKNVNCGSFLDRDSLLKIIKVFSLEAQQ